MKKLVYTLALLCGVTLLTSCGTTEAYEKEVTNYEGQPQPPLDVPQLTRFLEEANEDMQTCALRMKALGEMVEDGLDRADDLEVERDEEYIEIEVDNLEAMIANRIAKYNKEMMKAEEKKKTFTSFNDERLEYTRDRSENIIEELKEEIKEQASNVTTAREEIKEGRDELMEDGAESDALYVSMKRKTLDQAEWLLGELEMEISRGHELAKKHRDLEAY